MKLGLTYQDYYSLRVDTIYYDRDVLKIDRRPLLLILGDFMRERGEWKKISELRTSPVTNSDYSIENQLRDMEMEGYYFGGSVIYYEDGEPTGTFLDQPIKIKNEEKPLWFEKLFPYRLIQITTENRKWVHHNVASSRISDFLNFHLEENFSNDLSKFGVWLESIIASTSPLLTDYKPLIYNWIQAREKGFKDQPVDIQAIASNIGTPKFSQMQIATSIVIQQMVGSRDYFERSSNGKEKELQKIANEFYVAWKPLRTKYNSMTNKVSSEESIVKVISTKENLDSIKEILKDDDKATNRLNQFISKIPQRS